MSRIRYDDTVYKGDPDKIEQAKLADASRCVEALLNIIETQEAHKGKDDDIDLEYVSTVLDDKQLGIARRHKVSSSSSYVQQSPTTTANELWSHDVNSVMTYIQCGSSPENGLFVDLLFDKIQESADSGSYLSISEENNADTTRELEILRKKT